LILVLTEIKFAPILTLENMIPAIQEELRRKGFPAYSNSVLHRFQLGANAEPSFQTTSRWVFTSKDALETVTITTDSVVVQSTEYSTFENFLEIIKSVVDVLASIAEPNFADRIGLRYVDAVSDVGDSMPDYFNESVLSFTAEDLGVKSLLSSHYILAETETGHLQIRVNQVENQPLLPSDLVSAELENLSKRKPGVHAILDIDSSDERRSDFSWEAIDPRLWEVHTPASSAFWKSVTPAALAEWGDSGGKTA